MQDNIYLASSANAIIGQPTQGVEHKLHEIAKPIAYVKTATHTISINTADLRTLQTIPYIGLKRAQAIMKYRDQLLDKKFHSLQQLLEIKGINHKILARIESYLTI